MSTLANKPESSIPEPPPSPQIPFWEDKKRLSYYVFDILINALIIVVLVFFIRTFIISPFLVSGQSMCNTLNYVNQTCLTQHDSGELIIINKLVYFFSKPTRGDIIVFRPPIKHEDFYVKRIIGFPGEKIKIQNGQIFIQNNDYPEGFFLNEPYLNPENMNHTFVDTRLQDYVFEVPENHYFVLGDNRNASSDSRHWRDPNTGEISPYVKWEDIDGKVWLILWPFQNIRLIEDTTY